MYLETPFSASNKNLSSSSSISSRNSDEQSVPISSVSHRVVLKLTESLSNVDKAESATDSRPRSERTTDNPVLLSSNPTSNNFSTTNSMSSVNIAPEANRCSTID